MKRLLVAATVLSALALVVALALSPGATGAPKRTSGPLQLQSTFAARFKCPDCPLNTPAGVPSSFVGVADVPGLGSAIERFTNIVGKEGVCPAEQDVAWFTTAVIEIAGKGRIDVSMPGTTCTHRAPVEVGPLDGTITGGSGTYTGASGNVQFRASVGEFNACGCGGASDTWSGTLTVPGLEFDLTPPVLSGAVSKSVRAPKKAKQVRVRYTVKARDAVDASVVAACRPRSGSLFRVGRTVVKCSATDSSAHTATARFTVTVKKHR